MSTKNKQNELGTAEIVLKIVTERCQQNRWMNSKLSQRNKIASTEELNALAPLQDTWKRLNC